MNVPRIKVIVEIIKAYQSLVEGEVLFTSSVMVEGEYETLPPSVERECCEAVRDVLARKRKILEQAIGTAQ